MHFQGTKKLKPTEYYNSVIRSNDPTQHDIEYEQGWPTGNQTKENVQPVPGFSYTPHIAVFRHFSIIRVHCSKPALKQSAHGMTATGSTQVIIHHSGPFGVGVFADKMNIKQCVLRKADCPSHVCWSHLVSWRPEQNTRPASQI